MKVVVGTPEADVDCVDVVVFVVDVVVVCIDRVDDVVVFDVIASCDSVVMDDVDDAVEDVGNVEEVVFAELVVVEAADSASDMITGVVIVDEVDTLSVDITETVD